MLFFQHRNTLLIWASYGGHTEIVKLLLDSNCFEINAQDNVMLSRCIFSNPHNFNLQALAVCEQKGRSALITASQHGYREIVRMLLACPGIDANLSDEVRSMLCLLLAIHIGSINVFLPHRKDTPHCSMLLEKDTRKLWNGCWLFLE